MPQYFPLLVIGYPFNYRDFPLFDKICSKSSAADFLYVEKGLNNFSLKQLSLKATTDSATCVKSQMHH